MIEGLRLAPGFHHAAIRDPEAMAYLSSCAKCKRGVTRLMRQAMGCGFEPPAPKAIAVEPWKPSYYRGPAPTTCPGYTTALPDVVEIARAHTHWDKGALAEFCGGPPTEATLAGVEIYEGALRSLENAAVTPRSKGGLAEG